MSQSLVASMSRVSFLRKYVGRPFLFVNERAWIRLPGFVTRAWPMVFYARFLHSLVKLRTSREMYQGTFFLRNRPELELMRALSNQRDPGSTLRITVLGCSNGAEVYSIMWAIRMARPDLKIMAHAIDICSEIVEIAKKGLYSLQANERVNSAIFARLTEEEMRAMFDRENDQLRVKPWLREGIDWHVADAGDPGLLPLLGDQDIVVANNFLCHMALPHAERCLRNLARLVKPGGYLFVSGIDLDVRTKVALDSGWTPVRELLEDIHNGDPSVRRDWPWRYWGLEPFTGKRRDWTIRYASVFQLGHKSCEAIDSCGTEGEAPVRRRSVGRSIETSAL